MVNASYRGSPLWDSAEGGDPRLRRALPSGFGGRPSCVGSCDSSPSEKARAFSQHSIHARTSAVRVACTVRVQSLCQIDREPTTYEEAVQPPTDSLGCSVGACGGMQRERWPVLSESCANQGRGARGCQGTIV
jgi:hypothetical protein